MNKVKTWFLNLVSKHREPLLIVAAFLTFYVWSILTRWIDPTAGVYDIGVFQNNVTAVISLLIFLFVTWNVLGFIWPSIRTYFQLKFNIDFEALTPWQKITVSLLLYCFFLFCLVLLSKTIAG